MENIIIVSDENVIKTYKRRYFILTLLSASIFISSFQVYEQSSIADVIIRYYGVTYVAVSWTALLESLPSIFLFYHIGKFINYYQLRKTMLLATFFCVIGSFVKCFTLNRNHFWLLIISKIFPCFCYSIFYYVAPVLGATWFKPSEAGLVIGTLFASSSLGAAASFTLPLLFKHKNIEEIKNLFLILSLICLLIYSALLCLMMFVLVDKPPKPPSVAAKKRSQAKRMPLKVLFTNRNFVLIMLISFFVAGLIHSFRITLNKSILSNFEMKADILSITGILYLIFGIVGGLMSPAITRKYPKFKIIIILHLFLILLFTLLYLFSLWLSSVWLLYASISSLGITFSGLIVLLIDYTVEVSFPFPESISISLVYLTGSVSSLILTQIVTILAEHLCTLSANLVFVFAQTIAILLSMCLTKEMRRQAANRCENANEVNSSDEL
ncbi:Major facilitator superfamily MFS-1 domain containing protein-like protein [Dinothrombium tinctorium]|uniref:Major facilitator superfamily MFS-1 domain containing protein-like protein n=1 Tax=Dinothrombium tinctorium TaxID=1965070 RepID=A0A443R0S8_9ACAR|nr:Major facilitator superfamily MFS-1 domain containing protein-like protein [Dinothrombium tinctorium]